MHSEEIIERYLQTPGIGLAGNEYYGIDTAEDAARRAQARQDFFDHPDMRWPQIEYPRFNDGNSRSIRQLQALLTELGTDPKPDASINEAYEGVARKLAELYRVEEMKRKATYTGEQMVKITQSRERAEAMSSEVYRVPTRADFDTVLAALQRTAAEASPEIADYIGEHTSPVEPHYDRNELLLTDEAIRALQTDVAAVFPLDNLAVPEKVEGYTPEESVVFFQNTLDSIGMNGWRAVTSEGKALETSIARSQIEVGRNREGNFSAERLYALEMHEVIGHGLTGYNSLRQENPFLRLEMPGYVDFDEGRATALEQIVTENKRVAGEQYCLSIGLQLGLDQNGVKRDFRDTFEILWRRELLKSTADINDHTAVEQAKKSAYQQVLRTTRGGALDTRDLSYFEGGKRATRWFNQLAAIEDEEVRRDILRWSFSGRFDPTRRDHVELFIDQAPEDAKTYIMELVCNDN